MTNILSRGSVKRLGDVVVRVDGYEEEGDQIVLLATPKGVPDVEEQIRIRMAPGASKKAVPFEKFAARRGNDATPVGGLLVCEGLLLHPNGEATTRWPKVLTKDEDQHPVHIGGYGKIGLYYKDKTGAELARDRKGNVRGFVEYLDVAKAVTVAEPDRLNAMLAYTVESNEAAQVARRGAMVTLKVPDEAGDSLGRMKYMVKFERQNQAPEPFRGFAERVIADLESQLIHVGGVQGVFDKGGEMEIVPVSNFPILGATAEVLTKAVDDGHFNPKMPIEAFEIGRTETGRIKTGFQEVAICNGKLEQDAGANTPPPQFAYRIFRRGSTFVSAMDIDQVPTPLAPNGLGVDTPANEAEAGARPAAAERPADAAVAAEPVQQSPSGFEGSAQAGSPHDEAVSASRRDPAELEEAGYDQPESDPDVDDELAFLGAVMDEMEGPGLEEIDL